MSPLVIEHIPDLSGFWRFAGREAMASRQRSGVHQCNGERDYDHACKSKIDIHEVSIQNMSDGAILDRSQENEKFAVMI
ncbi:hypothetical protein AN403_5788 [Pseudomonas fluorescens]|uniref:Uncharacterized protein n=1 Tax=Pseudomonas fluorescens TaxID=294 RepID=A0A0P8Z8B7_PSEFL|nr:hypothetical protein AN403_5788 [Pseudomonas fluorescens]